MKEYDPLGAHIEMKDQENRIREAEVQFRNFLRQRPQPTKPSSGTSVGHDEASFLHPTSSRLADTEAAMREALARRIDPAISTPTGKRPEYNPQAQGWDPRGEGQTSAGQQGGSAEGDQGQSFDPEAQAFYPSGEQDGQAERDS